ncbi:hypothetical protein TeGR_g14188, partial [Tetraparma gracilis]
PPPPRSHPPTRYDGTADIDFGQDIINFISPGTPKKQASSKKIAKDLRRLTALTMTSIAELPESNPMTPYLVIGASNVLVALARAAPTEHFWTCLLLLNLTLFKLLHLKLPSKVFVSAVDKQRRDSVSELEGGEEKMPTVQLPAGIRTMQPTPPKQGSELAEALAAAGGIKSVAGTRIANDIKYCDQWAEVPHTFRPGNGTIFNVRKGPAYKKTGAKAPSLECLYDLYSCDLVRTPMRMKESGEMFTPPHVPGVTDIQTGNAYVPPMIIVSCGMPAFEPSLFGGEDDGPSYMAIFYFVIGERMLKELKDLSTASPAVKLLAEWCKRGEHENTIKGRFKCCCVLDDVDKLGLPAPIPSYNGKPVIINKTGAFFRKENHIELTIDVHNFAYLARKGLYSIMPKFPTMKLNVGFVIEGRDDDELPECMMGVGKLCYMDPGKAPEEEELINVDGD